MVWAWRTGRRFQIKGFIEIVSFTVSWLDRSFLPHICCTFITSDFKLFNSLKIFSLSVLWPCLCPWWLTRYKMHFSFFSSLSLFWPCLSREIWINFDRLQNFYHFQIAFGWHKNSDFIWLQDPLPPLLHSWPHLCLQRRCVSVLNL